MRFLAIIFYYLWWHYTRAILEFSRIYRNLVSFAFNFFSVPVLLRSYFAPWRRMGEDYPDDVLNFEEILSVVVVNLIMRLVGVFMRTIIILVGFIVVFLMLILYPILIFVWLLLPFIMIFLVFLGFILLFK